MKNVMKVGMASVLVTLLAALALCSLLGLHGCATYQLSKDATPAQAKAAHCADAQTAFTMSVALGDLSKTIQESEYWKLYKVGASNGIALYCAN